jgi:hypothetical protein
MGAALRLLPAIVEAAAWPILGYLVPVVKAGASVSQIRAELERLPGTPTEATLLAIARKAVNLNDATLGEVIWDNYFLPRALMSAVHMVIMAPGWRGGALVIAGRGLTDPLRKAFPGQREDYKVTPHGGGEPFTVKERYWSPYTSLMIGFALISYLIAELYQQAHGAGHVTSPLDVGFPRTGQLQPNGKPERVSLPGYGGIFYDILRRVPSSVLEYALGGTAPMPTMLSEAYHNETVFGTEIVDHSQPWRVQLSEYADWLKTHMLPISYTSIGRRAGTPAEKGESLMGISPASQRVQRSPAEQYLYDINPPAHRTLSQATQGQARQALKSAVRAGDSDAAREAAMQLGPKSRISTMRNMRRSSLLNAFLPTTLEQAVRAYELADPAERGELRVALARKRASLMPNVPIAQRQAMMERISQAAALPFTTEGTQ